MSLEVSPPTFFDAAQLVRPQHHCQEPEYPKFSSSQEDSSDDLNDFVQL